MSKFIVLLLLFVPALSTPSAAQPCIADTLAFNVETDQKTGEATYRLSSGAVYRSLPSPADADYSFTTPYDDEPWKGKGDLIFTCGDHVLLMEQCPAGAQCNESRYYIVPVVCLRPCLAPKTE